MIGRLWIGTPVKAMIGKHFCIYCGSTLKLKKNIRIIEKGSKDAQCYNYDGFGDFKVVWKKFYCSRCEKGIECTTQISYETHKKRDEKTHKILLEYTKPESIKRGWIDKNGISLKSLPCFDDMESDSVYKYIYFIDHKNHEYKLPLSEAKRIKLRERPFKIKTDKNYKSSLIKIKELLLK